MLPNPVMRSGDILFYYSLKVRLKRVVISLGSRLSKIYHVGIAASTPLEMIDTSEGTNIKKIFLLDNISEAEVLVLRHNDEEVGKLIGDFAELFLARAKLEKNYEALFGGRAVPFPEMYESPSGRGFRNSHEKMRADGITPSEKSYGTYSSYSKGVAAALKSHGAGQAQFNNASLPTDFYCSTLASRSIMSAQEMLEYSRGALNAVNSKIPIDLTPRALRSRLLADRNWKHVGSITPGDLPGLKAAQQSATGHIATQA